MKKIFTLLTLALISIGSAWAQTAISVTWLPNNMSAITTAGTASVDDILTVSALTYSSDVAAPTLVTYDSKKWGNFVPTTGTDKNKYSKDDYITFAVTVKTGYTFTPTGATAYAIGAGTGNNGAQIFATVQTSNGTNAIVNSSSASTPTALSLGSFSSTTYTAGQTVYFYIHIGRKSDATKGVCLRDVVLSGTYVDLSSPDVAPSFTTNLPSTDDATVGTEKTLSVTVSGKPSPTFQWYQCDDTEKTNASAIDGATSSTYTFTPAAAGTYYYYVVASNSEGNATSNVVTLTVAAETVSTPTITMFNKYIQIKCATDGATIYYSIDNADLKTSGSKSTYDGVFIPASNGTIYAYADKAGANASDVASKAYANPVGEVTGDFLIKLVPDAPAGEDTNYGSNTFTKAGYTLVSNATLTNSDTMNKYVHLFKAAKGEFTITPPSDVTIKSIKIYGVANHDTNKGNIQKASSDETVNLTTTQADLICRKNYISNVGLLSEVIITKKTASQEEGGTIKFKIGGDASQSRFYVEVYGTTSATSETITPAKTWTSYVPNHDLDFTSTDKLTAYIATAANSTSVTMTPIDKVPAGTPVVLKATETGSGIAVSVAATTDDVSANKLKLGDGATSIGGSGKYDYILSNGKFYHASAGVLPAGKCYLHLDAAPSGARELSLSFEDEATGVNEVRGKKEEGRDEFYNLAGQRVAQPTKGLYIVNGKKVIVK